VADQWATPTSRTSRLGASDTPTSRLGASETHSESLSDDAVSESGVADETGVRVGVSECVGACVRVRMQGCEGLHTWRVLVDCACTRKGSSIGEHLLGFDILRLRFFGGCAGMFSPARHTGQHKSNRNKI
jgi:hypothetical protein